MKCRMSQTKKRFDFIALRIKSNHFYLKFILFDYSAMSENSAADA